ncbi:hypothetical protein TALC_00898 [Thermoplasmatales archaeon BRNA1]|nr:hypothetical protein TALC_00898 [Thermoplasmatales archaeon BRNA1]
MGILGIGVIVITAIVAIALFILYDKGLFDKFE